MGKNWITVCEHLEEAKRTHRNWQEIAWTLGELKDAVEKALETAESQNLKDKILKWSNFHWLRLYKTVDIRHYIYRSRKVIEEFELQIPKVIEEIWFRFNDEPICYYWQTYYYDWPNWMASIWKDFWDKIKQAFNPFKKILDDIEKALEQLDRIINQLNQTDISYTNHGLVQGYVNELIQLVEDLEKNFFSIFLWDKSLYIWIENLRVIDRDRYVMHPVMHPKWYIEWVESTKRIIDRKIYESLPFLNKLAWFILRQLPRNNLVLDLDEEFYKSTKEWLISWISSYLVAKFQEQKEMVTFINLYKHLSSLTNSLRNFPLNEVTDIESKNNPNEWPITRVFRLSKERHLTHARQIKERLDKTLAIQRLTWEIADMIEQISLAWKLPPEIEKTLQTKADDSRRANEVHSVSQ